MLEHKVPFDSIWLKLFTTLLAQIQDANSAKKLLDVLASSSVKEITNVRDCTQLIRALLANGKFDHALEVLHFMDSAGIKPDSVLYILLFTACSRLRHFSVGEKVHEHLTASRITPTTELSNCLLNFYAKFGKMDIVQQIFDEVSKEKDSFIWTSMIKAYTDNGQERTALDLFL